MMSILSPEIKNILRPIAELMFLCAYIGSAWIVCLAIDWIFEKFERKVTKNE